MRTPLILELLRPRDQRLLVAGLLLLAAWTALRIALGPTSESSNPSRAVAEEVARRADAGDPIAVADRDWGPAREGIAWFELDSEPRSAGSLLVEPAALAACRERHAKRVAAHAAGLFTLARFDACAIWTSDADQLQEQLMRDELLRRDPTHWAAADPDARVRRAVRAFLMSDDRRDAAPCALGHRSGRERLEYLENPDFEDTSAELGPTPPIDWIVGQAEPRFAALEWAALTGSITDARRALEDLACLRLPFETPVLIDEFYPRLELVDRILREAEACLPLLGPEGADLLTTAVELCRSESNVEVLKRVLRGERATVYAQYLELGDLAELIEGVRVCRVPMPDVDELFDEQSLDESFLTYLCDSDAALAALELPFAQAADELSDLNERRIARDWHGWLSSVVFPMGSSLYGAAVIGDARFACAEVAGIAATEGAVAGAIAAEQARDPFNGLPLRSRLRGDGVFEVWSVGEDLVDDDGSTTRSIDQPDMDIVFRVKATPR